MDLACDAITGRCIVALNGTVYMGCVSDETCPGAAVCRTRAQARWLNASSLCICPPTRATEGPACTTLTAISTELVMLSVLQALIALVVLVFLVREWFLVYVNHVHIRRQIQLCVILLSLSLSALALQGIVSAIFIVVDSQGAVSDWFYNILFICVYVSFGLTLTHISLVWQETSQYHLKNNHEFYRVLRAVVLVYYVGSTVAIFALTIVGQWVWIPMVMMPTLGFIIGFYGRVWYTFRRHLIPFLTASASRHTSSASLSRDNFIHSIKMMKRVAFRVVCMSLLMLATAIGYMAADDRPYFFISQFCMHLLMVFVAITEAIVSYRVLRIVIHALARNERTKRYHSRTPTASKDDVAASEATANGGTFMIDSFAGRPTSKDTDDFNEVNIYVT